MLDGIFSKIITFKMFYIIIMLTGFCCGPLVQMASIAPTRTEQFVFSLPLDPNAWAFVWQEQAKESFFLGYKAEKFHDNAQAELIKFIEMQRPALSHNTGKLIILGYTFLVFGAIGYFREKTRS